MPSDFGEFYFLASVSDRKDSVPPSSKLGVLFVLVSPTSVLEHFFFFPHRKEMYLENHSIDT